MAGGVHERLVLGVGDQRARDEEAFQRLGPARALAVVPAALARDGVAVGGLVEPVAVLPLGRVGARDEGAGGNLDHIRRCYAAGVSRAREGRAGERETECEQGAGEDHPWNLFTSRRPGESQKFERKAFAHHHALADNSQRKRSSREARHATLETPACRNGGPRGHRARGRHRRPRHGRPIVRRQPGHDPAATGSGRAALRLVQPVRRRMRRLCAVQPLQPVQSVCGRMRPVQPLRCRMRSLRRVQPVCCCAADPAGPAIRATPAIRARRACGPCGPCNPCNAWPALRPLPTASFRCLAAACSLQPQRLQPLRGRLAAACGPAIPAGHAALAIPARLPAPRAAPATLADPVTPVRGEPVQPVRAVQSLQPVRGGKPVQPVRALRRLQPVQPLRRPPRRSS